MASKRGATLLLVWWFLALGASDSSNPVTVGPFLYKHDCEVIRQQYMERTVPATPASTCWAAPR